VVNAVLACSMSCAILIFCILAVNNAVGVVLFAAMYGIFSGAYAGLLGPMLALLAKSDSEIGERMGICFSLTAFGGLIGNPIAGALLTSSYTWWKPIIFAGLVAGMGSVCLSGARFFVAREKGTGIV